MLRVVPIKLSQRKKLSPSPRMLSKLGLPFCLNVVRRETRRETVCTDGSAERHGSGPITIRKLKVQWNVYKASNRIGYPLCIDTRPLWTVDNPTREGEGVSDWARCGVPCLLYGINQPLVSRKRHRVLTAMTVASGSWLVKLALMKASSTRGSSTDGSAVFTATREKGLPRVDANGPQGVGLAEAGAVAATRREPIVKREENIVSWRRVGGGEVLGRD